MASAPPTRTNDGEMEPLEGVEPSDTAFGGQRNIRVASGANGHGAGNRTPIDRVKAGLTSRCKTPWKWSREREFNPRRESYKDPLRAASPADGRAWIRLFSEPHQTGMLPVVGLSSRP